MRERGEVCAGTDGVPGAGRDSWLGWEGEALSREGEPRCVDVLALLEGGSSRQGPAGSLEGSAAPTLRSVLLEAIPWLPAQRTNDFDARRLSQRAS